jgi:hypothetical protein
MAKPNAKASKGKTPPTPDLEALAAEFVRQATVVAGEFKAAFEKVAEDTQFEFDKGVARFAASNPDLYAEVRRTLRQIEKTAGKAAETFGLKKK